jgi:hypothetical protein
LSVFACIISMGPFLSWFLVRTSTLTEIAPFSFSSSKSVIH